MPLVTRTIRSLVTAGLMLALGLTGVLPHLMVSADPVVRAPVPSPSPQCCCGTQTARCCENGGMGCCTARRAPAREPAPAPGNIPGSQFDQIALMIASTPPACGKMIGRRHSQVCGSDDRNGAEATLQARQVRIDC